MLQVVLYFIIILISSHSLLINISCSNQPVISHTKYPVDPSWLEYLEEINTLNQSFTFLFQSYVMNENVEFYIKTKKVLVKGFDQLPSEMKAYMDNTWISVMRINPTLLLIKENILNRTIFYEGTSICAF